MSDDAVDKFFDEMVSPASTPTESTPPDEADKPGEPDTVMDDSTGRDEPEHGPSTPGGVTDGLERPSFWTDDMERDFQEEVRTMFDDMVNRQRGELSVREQCEHAYEQLTAAVNGKYKELTGKDLPSSMARNLDQLLTQITMAPLNEPEHGPGLWAKLPQNSLATMVEARPLDLTGSPTRMDIDLMMLHTIRMGRFLTTHYTDWARTLPSCWIRHDDVVQEVYSLKCYMDMIVASPNGGLYAPTIRRIGGRYVIVCTVARVNEVKALAAGCSQKDIDNCRDAQGNFVIEADELTGPWRGPYWVAGAEGIDPDNGIGRQICGFQSFAGRVLLVHRHGVFEVDDDAVRAGRCCLEIPVGTGGRNEQGRKESDALAGIGHESLRREPCAAARRVSASKTGASFRLGRDAEATGMPEDLDL